MYYAFKVHNNDSRMTLIDVGWATALAHECSA